MPVEISAQYRLLNPSEVAEYAATVADAWKTAELPDRQYDIVVEKELKAFHEGKPILPYDVLLACIRELHFTGSPRLLDVGCACGYYSDVLAGFEFDYTGIDFSHHFINKARQLYPGVRFDVGDARQLAFKDGAFGVTLSGACLMHVFEYDKAIEEAARVSSKYVIFHRTSIVEGRPTEYWAKEAYGFPTLEVAIEHAEMVRRIEGCGLRILFTKDLFFDESTQAGHRTYVCERAR